MADTRKRICFQVSHPYRTRAEGPPVFSPSPCTVVSFPSKQDYNFKTLRFLHEKEVQTVVTTKDIGIQTEVRVPCNRWTQMQLQEVEEDKGHLENISKDVLMALKMAVEETAAVDPLLDEWGRLSEHDQTESLLHPLRVLQKHSPTSSLASQSTEVSDPEASEQEYHLDMPNIQRIKERFKKRLERQRTIAPSGETAVQKFDRIYKKQLKKCTPKEDQQ